jgi:hypothetical protein
MVGNNFFSVTVGFAYETKSMAVRIERVSIRRPTGFTRKMPDELAVRLGCIHLLV